jgi:hypothetical protein
MCSTLPDRWWFFPYRMFAILLDFYKKSLELMDATPRREMECTQIW